jgi:hypothetical protein
MPEDVPVWKQWLATHNNDWIRIDYDVHVGEGIHLDPGPVEPWRSQALALSQKRIDAVILYPDHVTIIEVKKLAGWKAIGQLIGYPLLYRNTYPHRTDIRALLIAEDFTLDTRTVLDHFDLPYEQVEMPPVTPPQPPLIPAA